jgi:hypothetical protein
LLASIATLTTPNTQDQGELYAWGFNAFGQVKALEPSGEGEPVEGGNVLWPTKVPITPPCAVPSKGVSFTYEGGEGGKPAIRPGGQSVGRSLGHVCLVLTSAAEGRQKLYPAKDKEMVRGQAKRVARGGRGDDVAEAV